MKVGFFGGSFDPFHFGHLSLMVEIKELCSFDRIFVCPAYVSPFKQDKPPIATPSHRLEMVKRGVADLPWAEATDREIKRPPPSYTIDTVRRLIRGREDSFHLILAEDSLKGLSLWKEWETLLSLAPPVIGVRRGYPERKVRDLFPVARYVRTAVMEISSQHIRERLAEGLYCGHAVPAKILDYIADHHLYLRG
ncbi:MAG: nicotinate (nicotinamide) nucleotide adenylyltransferase [Simkaniaceae bacterium]|nr:nicotinate (nicotinamide) nucleotide adenylyltransferase [Simkaniaceae bacterium]